LAPASRRNQMASRYLMGLALAVYGAVVIALIDGVQPLVRRDWSFTGNLWVAGVGGLAVLIVLLAFHARKTARVTDEDEPSFYRLEQ